MPQLFVSYSRANRADVDELIRRLPGLGYQAWVDSSLRGGQTWWEEILRRIRECDAFVAIVSRDSLNSVACQRELEWALALGKPLLPVALERLIQALPREISTRQIVDYSQPGMDAAYALAGALATLPPAPALPEVLPEPPATPLSYLTDLVEQVAQSAPLNHEQQRQIITQLQSALRSADPEEQQGALYILEKFNSRDDLYADVDRSLGQLRMEGNRGDTPIAPPPHLLETRQTDKPTVLPEKAALTPDQDALASPVKPQQKQPQPQRPQPQPQPIQPQPQQPQPRPQWQQPQPQPQPQGLPWQRQPFLEHPGPPTRPPNNYLIPAVLVTMFCCLPLGIVAIVKSGQVNGLWAQGRYAEAQASADSAKKWVIWSVVAGAIIAVIYVISVAAVNTSNTNAAMLAAMF